MSEELLTCRDVSCEFNIFLSLRNVSFSIRRGENIVIFGSEKSGADLMCSVLSGMQPVEGDVFYNGHSVRGLSEAEMNRMRQEVVYMQRNYGLISNMTSESLSRVIRDFNEDGICMIEGREVKILDMDKLEKISHLG